MNAQSIKAVAMKAITNPKVIYTAFAVGFATEIILRNKYDAKTIAYRKTKPKKYTARVALSAAYVVYGSAIFNEIIAKLVAMKELDDAMKD